jgi:hypothetical protein
MNNLELTIAVSVGIFLIFFFYQIKYFRQTLNCLNLYRNFFTKGEEYKVIDKVDGNSSVPQLAQVGFDGYDLNKIISEINHYIIKTKGTTDFSVIQNKVERNLSMRYEQAMAKLTFPTNVGLMGTFCGVFLGIFMFVWGFDGSEELRDASIRNLLIGVLISMSTSFIGLFLTTINTGGIGEAQKEVEEEKNALYDFIQTELMPSLDVSLVVAITKLHETVDEFEPAFEKVIDKFQNTFDRCTKAFGNSFEKNVNIVANAVDVMGKNMDKINENIELQKSVLSTFKSEEVVRGLEKYVEAADHFVGITQSLNKFEEARRMMLAAAQEAINLQNAYSESLVVPREVAVRINQILDRVKNFEANIERLGDKLNERDILGNDVVNAIRDQVNGIEKKSHIAESYLQKADGELEDLFTEQTKVIGELNSRYAAAINSHIDGFEKLMDQLTEDMRIRHRQFLSLMEDNLNVEMIHEDFSNLSKLSKLDQLSAIRDDMSSIFGYLDSSNKLLNSIDYYQKQLGSSGDSKDKESPIYIPAPPVNNEEVRRLKSDNQQLRNDIDRLKLQLEKMEFELKKKQQTPPSAPVPVNVTPTPPASPVVKPYQQNPMSEQRPTNEVRPNVQQVSAQNSIPSEEKDEPITYEEPQIIESHIAQKFGGNDIQDDEPKEELVEETPKKKGWLKWWPF